MKKCFYFIFLIMIFYSCSQLEIKRDVVENTFYSSSLPEIAIKISDDLKYIGKVEYSKVKTFYSNSMDGPIVKSISFIFGEVKNNYIVKSVIIKILDINRGYIMPDLFGKIKYKHDEGVIKLNNQEYQYALAAPNVPFTKEEKKFLNDKGYYVSNCYISKGFGKILGADQMTNILIVYSENLKYFHSGVNHLCGDWKNTNLLDLGQKEFINKFTSSSRKNIKVLKYDGILHKK